MSVYLYLSKVFSAVIGTSLGAYQIIRMLGHTRTRGSVPHLSAFDPQSQCVFAAYCTWVWLTWTGWIRSPASGPVGLVHMKPELTVMLTGLLTGLLTGQISYLVDERLELSCAFPIPMSAASEKKKSSYACSMIYSKQLRCGINKSVQHVRGPSVTGTKATSTIRDVISDFIILTQSAFPPRQTFYRDNLSALRDQNGGRSVSAGQQRREKRQLLSSLVRINSAQCENALTGRTADRTAEHFTYR